VTVRSGAAWAETPADDGVDDGASLGEAAVDEVAGAVGSGAAEPDVAGDDEQASPTATRGRAATTRVRVRMSATLRAS
jgi:hypothetical protein